MFERFAGRARRDVILAHGRARMPDRDWDIEPFLLGRIRQARARVRSAVAGGEGLAHRAARTWSGRATQAKPGGRWQAWVSPLAAPAAVAAVLGTPGVSSALHRPGMMTLASPARQAIAYVVNDSSPGTVTPIRTVTNRALAPIRVRPHPDAIAITPDGTTAYVVSTGESNHSGTVTPIRTATGRALAPIKVGGDPVAIAITPDGRTAYVANLASGTVTPIRTATNTALRPITVGGGPWTIVITPDGKTAYVASLASATVTPIRTATNTTLTPIKVRRSAHYVITITPDGKTAYVACPPVNAGPGSVIPIRTAANRALTPIKAVDHPMAIAITVQPMAQKP